MEVGRQSKVNEDILKALNGQNKRKDLINNITNRAFNPSSMKRLSKSSKIWQRKKMDS